MSSASATAPARRTSFCGGTTRKICWRPETWAPPLYNLRGDEFFQLDLRVAKNIKFGEGPRLKLIFQAFDLTNTANFGNQFNGSVRSPQFRQPTGFIAGSGVIVPRSFSGEIGAQFIF